MRDLISRKAAIDALNRLSLGETDAIKLTLRMNDYLKRLSSAESDVPDTNVGDMISKRAVLDILYLDPGIDEIREEMIKNLPSAQPERKNGRWISHPGGKFVGFPYMHYECNQCRDFEPEKRNFCPNCGADMRQ